MPFEYSFLPILFSLSLPVLWAAYPKRRILVCTTWLFVILVFFGLLSPLLANTTFEYGLFFFLVYLISNKLSIKETTENFGSWTRRVLNTGIYFITTFFLIGAFAFLSFINGNGAPQKPREHTDWLVQMGQTPSSTDYKPIPLGSLKSGKTQWFYVPPGPNFNTLYAQLYKETQHTSSTGKTEPRWLQRGREVLVLPFVGGLAVVHNKQCGAPLLHTHTACALKEGTHDLYLFYFEDAQYAPSYGGWYTQLIKPVVKTPFTVEVEP